MSQITHYNDTNKRSYIETTKRFFEPIINIKSIRIIGFFTMMNRHLFDLVTIIVTKEIGESVEQGNIQRMKRILMIYCGYFIAAYCIKYSTRNWGGMRTKYTLLKVLWKDNYERYFGFDISATEKIGTGKMIHILSTGVESRAEINHIVQYSLSDISVKLIIVGYLLTQLGIIYTILFLIIFIFLLRLSSRIYDNKVVILRRKKKELGVRNSGHMIRMLMSKIEILQINRIHHEIDQFIKLLSQQEQIAYKNMKWVFWMFNISLIVVHAFFPLIIVYVIISMQSGTFSYGMFVGLSVAAGTLGQFILKTTDAYKKILDNFVDIEKLRDIIDATPSIIGYETGNEFSYQTGSIHLDKVSFSYGLGDNDNVFNKFSIHIQGKKKTALVGASGSGKSTLVKLIAGYLRPDSGVVSVDGQDLTTVSLKSYYKHIGYLTQEPSVFDGSILDNITYAIDGEVSQEKLQEIIKLSKCEFIRDFPNGLHTQIGERGVRLSGGQRQRLAIAKIFLKNPEIIILDEPTAALDSFSEEAISEAMKTLFENRTVIIIAHRLQTVKHADDIIVLDEGEIIERGNHDDLMFKGGTYAKMLELQSGF